MDIKVQVGDFVHPVGDTSIIYVLEKLYPVWYAGRNNAKLSSVKHRHHCRKDFPSYLLVIAEPELLF